MAIYGALLQANPDNRYFLVSSTVPLMRLGELDAVHEQGLFGAGLTILKELDGRPSGTRTPEFDPWLEDRLGG